MNKDLAKIINEMKTVPLSKSKYGQRVQGFINFLSKTGNVEINQYPKSYAKAERVGVFVNKNLIGFLDFYNSEIRYKGEVPGAVSHLNIEVFCPSKKVYPSAPIVTIIYSVRDNKREDCWNIPFP